jgi:hypothetical protein
MLAGLVLGSVMTGPGAADLSAFPSLTPAALLDIAGVDAPPEGVGLQIHADFPEGAPLVLDGFELHSLTADLTPDGSVVVRSAHTATSGDSHLAGVGECDDPAFLPTGVKWAAGTMPIGWNLDLASTPDELKAPRTTLTVRAAHRIWPRAKTACDGNHDNTFSYDYLGPKRRNPGYDGISIVDFGPLGDNALAVNYTWYTGRNEIVEVDLRLNKVDYMWTNMDGVNRYNVRNVVAHELGHQVGLDDLGEPHSSLTMYALIGKSEVNKATLGRGDMRGAETLSP